MFPKGKCKRNRKALRYILFDNRPDTSIDKQVLLDIFGSCHCYPTLSNKPSKSSEEPSTVTGQEQPVTREPTVQLTTAAP